MSQLNDNRPLVQGIPLSSSSHNSTSSSSNISQPVIVFPSVVRSNQDTANNWHSQILSFSDCLKDEETSWWGLWCCWIVNARNIQLFGLGDSFREAAYFWGALVLFILLLLFTGPFGYVFALGVFIYSAYRRATLRSAIRQKLSIPGTFSDDFIMHGFCSCCTICQEAREAKAVNLPAIDWCFGEPLLAREDAHDYAVSAAASSSSSSGSTSSLLDCAPHFNSLSKTSKFIVFLWGLIALLTIFMDLLLNESANILVLILIFVQPILILYFVYWKARRQYAYLDYVVKTFAYGFWFSTFQSAILESLFQLLMGIVVAIVAPSLAGADKLTEDEQKQVLIQNIVLVIIGLFFMAFVVAAGVEETMKHFVVRCCQFPSTLKDPHSILVYLLAAALGFATAENIEYVFSQGQDAVSGVAMLEGELLILLMRVLTPVHAICSVLQAVNLSKVLVGQEQMNLFQVLLPAVALHGSFDFILFLLGALGFMFDWTTAAFELSSLFVALSISTGGGVWAYYSFKKVESQYRDGWRPMADEETIELNSI